MVILCCAGLIGHPGQFCLLCTWTPETNRNHCSPFLLLSAVLELSILDGDVKCRDLRTSVTPVFTLVLFNCWLKLPLFSHWSMINEKHSNSNVTACYITDTTVVANQNNHFPWRPNYVNATRNVTKLNWSSEVVQVTARN